MEKELFNTAAAQSDDDLLCVTGGIADQDYAAIKAQLDAAASNDDFDTFSAIVVANSSTYGRSFFYKVVDDYTRSKFLTSTRFSLLMTNVVGII